MVRQFNLAGAGQTRGFMVADFAYGIASVEAGRKQFMSVGNLESARDSTDANKMKLILVEYMELGRAKRDRINGKPLSENAAKSGFFSGNLGI